MAAPIGPIPLLVQIQKVIVQPFVSFLLILAFAYFVWGVVDFIRGASEPKTRAEGQQHMLWGLIGIAIMVSVVGILNLVCKTIGCS